MSRRVRWEVHPVAGSIGWVVTRNKFVKTRRFFKFRAVEFAVNECNADLDQYGIHSELFIKGRNGKILDCRTYGNDPPKVKG